MKNALLATLFIGVLLMCGIATALPTVEYVKINGDIFTSGDQLVVERGDTLDIKVKLVSATDVKNVEIAADILGYEYNDFNRISDASSPFDMAANDTVYKTLQIKVPTNVDRDKYDLRVRVGSRTGNVFEGKYLLNVKGARHQITIRDIVLSPENTVQPGRALLATVRIKNYGEMDEEGIKIKASIPALGVSASDYVDTLDMGDSTTSEELYMRIPDCASAKPGVYSVLIEVEYDEGYEKDSAESSIMITEDETCKPVTPTTPNTPVTPTTPQTIISVGATTQDVTVGAGGVVYPITITNAGSESKIYSIVPEGASEWADVRVSPSSTMIVAAGETKAAFVYVASKGTAQAGQRMFTVTVSSNGEPLKQIPMTANVVKASSTDDSTQMNWNTLKRGLEIGLVVLVILLVILGLIIGFNKLKGSGGEEEQDKSYY